MPEPTLLQRLKERKLVQWALAYLAGAFVVFQCVEVMAEPWGLSPAFQRGVTLCEIGGVLARKKPTQPLFIVFLCRGAIGKNARFLQSL